MKKARPDGPREVLIEAPNEKQKLFFEASTRYIGYGGAKGGGKSWAVRVKAFLGALAHPGIRILIMRQHYPELNHGIIQPMLQLVPPELAGYNAGTHIMRFENGSVIVFGHWDGESATQEYNGLEFDWIFIDEATQFTEEAFWFLGGCLRGVNEFPKRMYITCNPGGIGHRWVKRLFIDKRYTQNPDLPEASENPEDFTFVFATVEDNTALLRTEGGRGYLNALSKMPNARAYRYGDWDALGGHYFGEFSKAHIVKPFQLPAHWNLYRAFDYGLDMLAVLWLAVDEDGRGWCFREYEQSGLIVSQAAQMIRDATLPHEAITATYAPPDMWSRQKDSGKTMAELFAENGVGIVRAANSRVQGHMAMKEMLAQAPVHDPFVKRLFQGRESMPRLMFFSTCRQVTSCIQDIQADEKNPNDCATQPHEITHPVDACRYFCVMRAMQATAPNEALHLWEQEQDEEDYETFMCGEAPTLGYLTF